MSDLVYINQIDDKIYALATSRQREVIDVVRETGNLLDAAKQLGISPSNVSRRIKGAITRATFKGYNPEVGLTSIYPDGFLMEKTTIHRHKGEIVDTWERMNADKEKSLAMLKLAVSAVCDEMEPFEAVPLYRPEVLNDDLMVIIPIGDAHIGMLAWELESDEEYNLQIAEQLHCQAVDMLIESTPAAAECTIIDLGDFMHADNMAGISVRGGNVMDMAGVYPQVLQVAIRVSIYYIEAALKKYGHVTYRPEIGNHNECSAIAMQAWLSVLYKNEPRVTIGDTAGVVYFWQHGLCYFGSHHGHTIKFDKLPDIMAAQVMNLHINTRYRKFYVGHIHHKKIAANEFNVCDVQSYRTLAAKDAFHKGHGYASQRSITAEVWHKEYGCTGTVEINLPMIEARHGK